MTPWYRIVVAMDGSAPSALAAETGCAIAAAVPGSSLSGCHVYAARLHRTRFGEMEPGLPPQYQAESRLAALRSTHDDLIGTGMRTIAGSYLAPLEQRADALQIPFTSLTPEGKHYVEILRVLGDQRADLCICGATGLGSTPGALLGSVAERLLLHAGTDVLIARDTAGTAGRPVIACIDGSGAGAAVLSRAIGVAHVSGSPVIAVSVYDPYFHTGVFRTIAASLSGEAARTFDFSGQETLHDAIINDGLGQLYEERLRAAVRSAGVGDAGVETRLLKGKTCPEIARCVRETGAWLVVAGRFGSHYEPPALIGSNALGIARTAPASVLIVAGPGGTPSPADPVLPAAGKPNLDADTGERGGAGTFPARTGAEIPREPASAEQGARDGRDTAEEREHLRYSSAVPSGEVVVFRKVKRFAPDFHRHMVSPRVGGTVVKQGDRVLVYEIAETVPSGPVLVTGTTRLEFR